MLPAPSSCRDMIIDRKYLISVSQRLEQENEESIHIAEKALKDFDTVIISLFVPKAKPLNNFDIEESVLTFLSELFKNKNCILYVFGNPYSLQVIPNIEKAVAVFEMYQDFVEFQEIAAKQLLGNKECRGTLPVYLKTH